jgi:hypothetical protein
LLASSNCNIADLICSNVYSSSRACVKSSSSSSESSKGTSFSGSISLNAVSHLFFQKSFKVFLNIDHTHQEKFCETSKLGNQFQHLI